VAVVPDCRRARCEPRLAHRPLEYHGPARNAGSKTASKKRCDEEGEDGVSLASARGGEPTRSARSSMILMSRQRARGGAL
jgi:hypothetical protein